MNKPLKITRSVVLTTIAVIGLGCARGSEFSAPEQKGASHQDTYPNFSIKPRAATQQFTEAEKQALTDKLDSQAAALKKASGPSARNTSNLAKAKEDARREAEDTIREIEQSGK